MEKFVGAKEACEYLNISRYTLKRWMKLEDPIPFYQPEKAKHKKFRMSEIEEWAQRQKKEGNSETKTQ